MNSLVENSRTCAVCGAEVPSRAPEGICIACLLENAGNDHPIPGAVPKGSPASLRYFGDYEILGEAGEGGMGIVYRARQFGTQRVVALKLLRGGFLAQHDAVQRFHIEARAAASLIHPRIVPVYECGLHENQYFLTMPFLAGGTLASRIKESPMPALNAARIMLSIAEAVAFAHQRGVLHRDLKPGNILFDEADQPSVADFGLARIAQEETALTLSGAVLGTAAYMAPEQTAGTTTVATDIYSLGAILYELLSGRPPFHRANLAATLRAILDEQPSRPRELNPAISLDLETICLKCMEKDPSRRYQSAQAFADDLQHFLNNEPIMARPVSRATKVIRWSQRNPALATAYSVLLLLLILILICSPLAIYRINEARKAEVSQRSRAEEGLYAADMLLAQGALDEGKLRRANELLDKHDTAKNPGTRDLRGWEWNYYKSKTGGGERFVLGYHQPGLLRGGGYSGVSSVGFLPGGTRVWSAGWDKKVRIWDFAARREILTLEHDRPVFAAAHSPDGRWLATITASEGNRPAPQFLRLWDLESGQQLGILATNKWPRPLLAFSPDGRLLATEDIGRIGISILELSSRREVAFLSSEYENLDPLGLAFSPKDQTVAYAVGRNGEIGEIVLFDLSSHSERARLHGHSRVVDSLSFSPDGRILASAGRDHTVRLWDLSKPANCVTVTNFDGLAYWIQFSPDGRRLGIVDETESAKLLEISTGKIDSLRGHIGILNSLAFSPDSRTVLTGGEDGSIRVWNADSEPITPIAQPLDPGQLVGLNRGHELMTLTPDASHLLTILTNGTFGIWDVRAHQRAAYAMPYSNVLEGAIAPNARAVVLSAKTGPAGQGAVIFSELPVRDSWRTVVQTTNAAVGRMRFSPDGGLLAVSKWPEFDIFEASTLRKLQTHLLNAEQIRDLVKDVAFSDDNHQVAAVTHLGWVYCWDLLNTNRHWAASFTKSPLNFVCFSPDRQTIVATGFPGVFLLDAQNGRRLPNLNPDPQGAQGAAFSPDGKTLALAQWPEVSLWSTSSDQLLGRLRGHREDVLELGFQPDSHTLVTVSLDELRLWPIRPTN